MICIKIRSYSHSQIGCGNLWLDKQRTRFILHMA